MKILLYIVIGLFSVSVVYLGRYYFTEVSSSGRKVLYYFDFHERNETPKKALVKVEEIVSMEETKEQKTLIQFESHIRKKYSQLLFLKDMKEDSSGYELRAGQDELKALKVGDVIALKLLKSGKTVYEVVPFNGEQSELDSWFDSIQ